MRMLRESRQALILFVCLLILCNSAKSIDINSGSQWLVSPELLEQAQLKILWQSKLPIKENETLAQLFAFNNRVYALSSQNYLVSLSKKDGNIMFERAIAPAGFPILGLQLYQNELIYVIANSLVEIDVTSAKELRTFSVDFSIACPVARNSSFLYIAGTDRCLHVLRASDRVQIFKVAAADDSMITSVVADENFVIFGTDSGRIVCIAPDRPLKLWQFEAAEAITGPIIKDGRSLFFASKDTNVYRLDMMGMTFVRLAWKFQTEAILDRAPCVAQDFVYQYAYGKGLTAIDRQSGRLLWSLPSGLDLLTEKTAKAYLITNKNTLVIMDNYRAKKLFLVNFADVSRYVSNTTDSNIYIADNRGWVACLEAAK